MVRLNRPKAIVPAGPEPRVSDHALVRWLERVEGYPLHQVRAEMLSAPVLTAMRFGDAVVHRPARACSLVVRNWTVVTVLPLVPVEERR